MEGQLSPDPGATGGAYFRRLAPDRLAPTALTAGAWSQAEQHVAPTIGLCVHELERRAPSDLQLARLGVDVLGVMTLDPVEVQVEVLRPGRTIELAEVVVVQAGRPVVRARVWRLASYDAGEVAGGAGAALPPPEDATAWPMHELWPGAFIGTLDVRAVSPPAPGRGTAWVGTGTDLVADEEVGDLARWVGLLDTANGIAVRCSPTQWLYPNVDLTLHLHRRPTGRWLGLDTEVVLGAEGLGLTSSTVHDRGGPVGRLEQSLTVRRR